MAPEGTSGDCLVVVVDPGWQLSPHPIPHLFTPSRKGERNKRAKARKRVG